MEHWRRNSKMKRHDLTSRTSKRYSALPIYLEDLEYILDQFKENKMKVEISDGEFSYDNIAEVKENKGDIIGEIKIRALGEGVGESITFEVDQYGTEISARSSKKEILLVWHEINNRINSKNRWYYIPLYPPAWVGGSIGTLIMLPFAILMEHKVPMFSVTTLVICLFGLLASLHKSQSVCKVHLYKKHAANTFIKRNGDKIIMLILGSILTLIAEYIISKLR
jgi:hypothetical protein